MLIALAIFGMITAAGVALLTPDRAHPGDARSGCSTRSARCGGPAPCSTPISARRRRASTATATAGRGPPSPAAMAARRAAARPWCGAAGRMRARSARRCSGSNIGCATAGSSAGATTRSTARAGRSPCPCSTASAASACATATARASGATRWDPTDPARLPVAVEMVSDSAGQGEVRQLFLVGSGR